MLKNVFIFFLVFFVSIKTCASQASELRIEPPFWWAGMKTPNLQLMFKGTDLCKYTISVSHPNVSLKKIHQADNCNYVFIDLEIIKSKKEAFDFPIEFKNKKETFSINYTIKENPSRDAVNGFDQKDAIYLITPDRFANGNPENDSHPEYLEKVNRKEDFGRHGGDLLGIKNKLDYISNLGFTAVWLNPLLENDMPEYSYHGYACTDFYRVDQRFSSNEGYRDFVAEAHKKGLKVIMDMIVNHCGSYHWWMNDLPFDDWINQWSNYTETNHQKSTLQDPNVSTYDKKVYTDGWFVPTMPDLNQRNPFLATYLIQNSIWWTNYLGLNGIRMDTYSYSDNTFMVNWVNALKKEFPRLSIVGEEWNENPSIISYWQDGKLKKGNLDSRLEFLMDFPLNLAVAKALSENEGWGTGLVKIYNVLAQDFQYPKPHNLLIFPDNHDMSRIYAQLDNDIDKLKMATGLYLTMRGIPQFYYGTEILMTSPKERNDGKIRSDFPGGWNGDKINAFDDAELKEEQLAYKNYLSQLLKWRQSEPLVHKGKLTHFVPFKGFYVYFRHDQKNAIMVILNKNFETTALELNRFDEILHKFSKGVNVLDASDKYTLKKKINVKGNSITILKLK